MHYSNNSTITTFLATEPFRAYRKSPIYMHWSSVKVHVESPSIVNLFKSSDIASGKMEFLGSCIYCYCRRSVGMNFNLFKNNLLQCFMGKPCSKF